MHTSLKNSNNTSPYKNDQPFQFEPVTVTDDTCLPHLRPLQLLVPAYLPNNEVASYSACSILHHSLSQMADLKHLTTQFFINYNAKMKPPSMIITSLPNSISRK